MEQQNAKTLTGLFKTIQVVPKKAHE